MKIVQITFAVVALVVLLMAAGVPAMAQTAYTYASEGFEQSGIWPASASSTEQSVTSGTGSWKIKAAFQKGSYAHGGTYELSVNSGGYLVTPQLTTGAGTLTYFARSTSTTARTVTIQKSTDGTTYTTVTTINTGGSSYVQATYAFNDASIRYIKLVEPSSGGAYFDDFAVTSGGGGGSPSLSVTPTSLAFGNVTVNTTSAERTYALTGASLTPASGNITVTAPAGFQVSATTGTGFASSITVAYTGGALAAKTIYARFSPTAVQNYSGNLANAGGGAAAKNVAVTGAGVAAASPTLSVTPTSLAYGNVTVNTTSAEKTYALSGASLTPASGNITVTAPAGFQVSATSGSGFASSITVAYTGSALSAKTIYARFSPTAVQNYSGNVANVGGGASTQNVAVTGAGVNTASPALSVTPTSLAFGSVTVNTTSAEKTYTLAGTSLTPASGNITVTAPAGFQVSATTGSGFASSITVAYTGGALSSKTLYARFTPTGVQNYSGNVSHAGGGASTKNVAVTGTGASAPPPPATGMIGYATVSGEGYTTTTGGQGGAATTVSTLADLLAYATSCENNTTPKILYISGKISSSSTTVVTIKHGANISIYGRGSTSELMNVGLNIVDYKNVIVQNLKIHEVFYPSDALTIDACQHVWVDHNELYSKMGAGITVDTYDGLMDIKKGSRYVTVSWNYLHDHMKVSLIGHTDNSGQQAEDSQIRVTIHHNYYSNTDGRNPSLRFGAAHIFNNYFRNIADYGLAARDGAHAKVENNVYENVLLPMSTDKFPVSGLPNGYICESGNLLTGTTGAKIISQTGCDFWNSTMLPYAYTLDAASSVTSTVPAGVGVGKVAGLNKEADPIAATMTAPKVFRLLQNYPNPFNPSTVIAFSIPEDGKVSLKVFDVLGREVATLVDGELASGILHQVTFDASRLSSGVYFYRLATARASMVKKLMIMK